MHRSGHDLFKCRFRSVRNTIVAEQLLVLRCIHDPRCEPQLLEMSPDHELKRPRVSEFDRPRQRLQMLVRDPVEKKRKSCMCSRKLWCNRCHLLLLIVFVIDVDVIGVAVVD